MTVRDLIIRLLDQPPDAMVFVGKGMGPVADLGYFASTKCVVLEPARAAK